MELLQSQAPVDQELLGSSASARHGTSDIGHQTWDVEHGTFDYSVSPGPGPGPGAWQYQRVWILLMSVLFHSIPIHNLLRST